jgi:membrane associated rhomboid family serine protease
VSARSRFAGQLRITRGALIVAGLELGLSLIWLLSDDDTRHTIANWLAATPSNVFEHGRVWTLVTGPFLEVDFIGLLLHVLVLWMFVPTLERFWGTARFYRFVAITSIVGTLVGTGVGYLVGTPAGPSGLGGGILGLNPFIYSSIVAFGIVYARQPVQFFGVLPLTGRQLMYGFMGFLLLFVLLQAKWAEGASFAAAMIAAAMMTSKRWSPGLAWRRWRIARARAHLTVMTGGQGGKAPKSTKGKPDERKWLN